jgi:serine/threonine protein kinase
LLEIRHEGTGLIANRFKPIRVLRHNLIHARDGRRHVAIELVPASDHDLGAMRRAIAIANAIDHPNLCRPREVLEHADQLVIVTELVEGVSIGDRLVIGPFDPLQVGALMVELLSVLSQVHAAGIAHGGISPSTVMIDATGLLRLMDLGVSRGPHRPTARLDLEAVGALAATMLAGYLGSVPAPLLAWIARCSDQVRPFADAAAAAAGLVTPDVVSTEALRTRTLAGVGKKLSIPPRTDASVAIKIPTLDQPARPLEVVSTDLRADELRRGRTPSALVKVSDVLALVEAVEVASPVAVENAAPVAIENAAPVAIENAPPAEPPRTSRFPWLAGGLAAAVAAAAIFVWWSDQRGADAQPQPLTAIAAPSAPPPSVPPHGRPPLPAGAVLAPDAPPPAPIDDPPVVARPVLPQPVPLEVGFSPEAAWIETAGVYVLEEAFRQLVKHPLARVEVIGYSSSDGEGVRNTQLAIGRALAVKKYLVERGVDGARIAITAKANTKSRRAELRIVVP